MRLRGAVAWSAVLFCVTAACLLPSDVSAQARCTGTGASSPAIVAEPTAAERALRFRDAWEVSDGAGVTIAIIDTGVADHPRLGGVIDGGDVTGTADAFHDCDAHGTFVAGLAAGRPGGDSFAGVAPGATVLSIRHTTGDAGTLLSLADAIDSAVRAGARVINISLTSCAPPGTVPPGAPEVTAAVQRAEGAGSVVVAAAGNADGDCPDGAVAWPAILEEVIAVTAVDVFPEPDADHSPAGYALTADWVDVAAPGGPVVGPSPDGETIADLHVTESRTSPISGTSFAAPLVSGTAALILSRDPSLSPEQVRRIIADTASPAATTVGVGAGVIDPVAAVARTGVDRGIRTDEGDATTGAASAPTPPPAVDHVPSHRIAALGAIAVIAVVARTAWSGGTVRDGANDRGGAVGRAPGDAVRSRPMRRSS